MKNLTRYTLTAAAACALLAAAGTASAQQCNIERKVTAKALTEASYNALNKVYEDIGEEKYNDAAEALNKMLTRAKRDEYEQAIIHQALAQVEWARERFDSSLSNFEKAVGLNTLPDHAHFALMYQIAQLYAMNDRNREALERLDLWLCAVPKEQITSAVYVLQASIYGKMEDYRKALTAIDTAISMDDNPKESWYQLKLASHFELEQFPQAADTLVVMIESWPDKKTYWTQLSSIYIKLKQDKKAVAILAAAYRKGMLTTESEIKQLANLYQFLELPYKSAALLEKGIADGIVSATDKHWDSIGQSWYMAEEMEKALVAYEKAGAASSDGKIDLKRAYILVDMEKWADGREALTAALEKGGLEDRKRGDAYLLRGMCNFGLENTSAARNDFEQAIRFEKTRQAAQQWINHMNLEAQRQAP